VPQARAGWTPYLVAVGAAAAAVVVRLALQAWVSASLPFLPFFAAAVAASAYGGLGPGIVASALAAAGAWLVLSAGSLSALGASGGVTLTRFLIVAIVVSWLNDRIRRARAAQVDAAARFAAQQASMRESEEARHRLAAIVESSEDSILGIDRRGTITSWNRGAERLYGYAAAEAVGRPMTLVIPPDRQAEEERLLADVLAGRRVEIYETERLRKDGTRLDVAITLSPIHDASGRITGASKIGRDITDRRRALTEAMAARDRLAFLAEVSALLASSLDYQETLDRAVHLALPRLGDFCNVLVEDEQGHLRHVAWGHVDRAKEPAVRELVRRVLEAVPRPDIPTFAEVVMKTGKPVVVGPQAIAAAAERVTAKIDAELLALGNTIRPHAYVGVPLLTRSRPIGVLSFGTSEEGSRREYVDVDVTLVEEFGRRVSAAIENARLFRQADELNRLKDEFLATLSHELRTPLSAIVGWSRMLSTGQLDAARAARAIEAIERNAQAQSQIVDDILDVARGMAGNLRLDVAPVDLVLVAHRAVEAIAPAAAAKRLDVTVVADEPVIVMGDAGRLQQVIWNLLSNAVKFTNPGGRVAACVGVDDSHAELAVSDSGIGITPAFLPFVFDKFRQGDGSFSRRHGGLGLGLAIARHLVELHGGSIEARSDGEGRGATFVVRLPLPLDA
jgi:PAS domain S-box-containing protein